MSVLELRRVSRVYGQGAAEVHALREVSLDVDAGTMVAVMGPSGSGKSTLLTIAGSLEEPTSGQVLVAGQDLAAPPRDELVMKVLVAMRVPGIDVHDVIQVHRRYLVELMQQWTRIKEAEAESDLSLAVVVDAELFRLDSVIRWLDAADGRIKRAAPEPPGEPGAPAAPRAPRRRAHPDRTRNH